MEKGQNDQTEYYPEISNKTIKKFNFDSETLFFDFTDGSNFQLRPKKIPGSNCTVSPVFNTDITGNTLRYTRFVQVPGLPEPDTCWATLTMQFQETGAQVVYRMKSTAVNRIVLESRLTEPN